jgi:hypothetical protein
MLRCNGFAPRWVEVDKEIWDESEQAEKLLATLKECRERLKSIVRVRRLRRNTIRCSFELERARALDTYTNQFKILNQKIQGLNLVIPF